MLGRADRRPSHNYLNPTKFGGAGEGRWVHQSSSRTRDADSSCKREQRRSPIRLVGEFGCDWSSAHQTTVYPGSGRDSRQSVSFSCLHALMFEGFVHTRACWAAQPRRPFSQRCPHAQGPFLSGPLQMPPQGHPRPRVATSRGRPPFRRRWGPCCAQRHSSRRCSR